MARLPSAEQLGQRPTPSGRGGISRLQLSTPQRGIEAQAEAQFGKVIQGMGDTIAQIGFNEKEKVAGARIEEAYNQYSTGMLELEYGQEQGFINILGGEAVKQPLVDDYRKRREAIAIKLRDGLDDDAQKTAFSNRVMVADRQFDARLYRHVAEQSRIYQDQVGEGVFATERANAGLNYDQPNQIAMSLARVDKEIERQARVKGITDVDVINDMKRKEGTLIHANVMEQMLAQGRDSAAEAYYNGVKSELMPEVLPKMESKIRQARIEGESIRAADTVWNVLGPKLPGSPIELEKMEVLIRDRYKGNPDVVKAAISDIRSRAVAHKDQVNEQTASHKSKVLGAYHDGATLEQLQLMPEYTALDGEERIKLREYIVDSGWTQDQRARQQAQYEQGAKSARAYSAYWELSNPKVLSTMSEEKILALEPVLGTKVMGELIEAKRKMADPANVKAATIDAELFNVIAADAGLKPYDKTLSTEDKEYMGRLKNEVEAAIDVAQRGGQVMGRKEKEELMRSMIDKKVMRSNRWSSDEPLPAAVIKPADRKNVYVPIDQIDSNWLKGAMNYIRSTEPGAANWTDAEIKRGMKGRLERGYAISITGGTSAEGRKALEGKDDGDRQ